jgi:cysteine dioxygenase
MSPAVISLLRELDCFTDRVPLEVLAEGLRRLEISLADVRAFARFGREHYQRNLVHAGPAYEALLLCWLAGQRSPIHDHRGSNCAFRVIEGDATETRFDRTAQGHVFPVATKTLVPGTICATHDDDLHQVSNLQPPDTPLVTLHIYSPALRVCNVFSLTEPESHEWYDPVVMFGEGSGI